MRRRIGQASAPAAALMLTLTAGWAMADVSAPGTDASARLLGARGAQVAEPVVVLRALDPSSRLSEKGGDLWRIGGLGSFDVPEAAMRAYRSAADATNEELADCDLPWSLLAAIGRVESDHGRFGGSVLGADGVPRPAIRGVALDGVGPVAAIPDSDDGRFDGDAVWDRAVGPMQFIPGTWASAGRDGDGDGDADPNDIDDAALAAAGYLCPSSGSIRADGAMEAAVLAYNHSDYYVSLVLAFEDGYRTGSFTIPSPPVADQDSAHAAGPAAHGDDRKQRQDRRSRDAPRPHGPRKDGPESSGGDRDRDGRPQDRPAPSPTPSVTPSGIPDPTPAPVGAGLGVLTSDAGGWHLDGRLLDLGVALGDREPRDYDGDGAALTAVEELTALLGRTVSVEWVPGSDPLRVTRVNDLPW